MTLFLSEDKDFKGFWMKIWNAGVSVITRSSFSSCDSDAMFCVKLSLYNVRRFSRIFKKFFPLKVYRNNANKQDL
jgi:hypothetical protein